MTNPGGRTLVMGDIHGCNTALATLLDELKLTPQDTLVVLGDVVDRGPDTRAVIDMLLDVRERATLVAIMGNHEEMLLEAMQGGPREMLWLQHGGLEALESYGGQYSHIPPEHVEFMQSMLGYYETAECIFTHANLEQGVLLEDQSIDYLRWVRYRPGQPPWPTGQTVYVGHTPQPSGMPHAQNNWVCIDTYAYGGKYLTCADVATGEMWQASDNGELLSGMRLGDDFI